VKIYTTVVIEGCAIWRSAALPFEICVAIVTAHTAEEIKEIISILCMTYGSRRGRNGEVLKHPLVHTKQGAVVLHKVRLGPNGKMNDGQKLLF